jgi:general secretion pathway protein G
MNMIQKRMEQRGQGGFTLIELLVVIAILAILAGVVIFAVNGVTQNAANNACNVERQTIRTAQAAAESERPAGDPEDYLEQDPKYFVNITRTSAERTLTDDVSEDACEPI